MLVVTSFMSAGNQRQLNRIEICFGFKNKNNLIDLIENSNKHALVGEVLIIRKLKCKNRGHDKFSPGLALMNFVQLSQCLNQ